MPSEETMRDLSNGLVLRRSTSQDTEDLVAFYCENHPPPGAPGWVEYIAAWIRGLVTKPHPTFSKYRRQGLIREQIKDIKHGGDRCSAS
jgi:hypothetical protein